MTEPEADDLPLTIGDLRRRLSEMGQPWTVDPQRGDEEPLRDRPRGGLVEGAGPDEVRPAAVDPARDLREVLTELPPANPALRQRWVQEGLLDEDGGV
jgi:hypothetical protein